MKKTVVKCRDPTLVSFAYVIRRDRCVAAPQHELQWCLKPMT